ncbi:MAG: DinB family protein [Anaerolineae bacterium]|nr:DinB family protein [Anaerolineae bacterium]
MPEDTITPAEIETHLATLTAVPGQIAALTTGLDAQQVRWKPDKRDWSLVDNLAHLRGCADVWGYSIYAMLVEDNPSLARFSPRDWAKTTRMAKLEFGASLHAYTLQREQLLLVLRPLPEAAWARTASIAGWQHTIFSQARRMALHESQHVEQMTALAERLRSS